jgi:hypothetical protein
MSHNISNFDFLKKQYPRLASLGLSSELYSHTDHDAALIKLRCFCELLVGQIYQTLNIAGGEHDDLNSRLNNEEFKNIVDKRICTKLHVIRQNGNKAAHENLVKKPVTAAHVVWLIKETYLVGRWFLQTINNTPVDTPDFIEPKKPVNIEKAMADERTRLLEELDSQKSVYVDEKNRLITESETLSETAQTNADALDLANLELEKLRQALRAQQDEIRNGDAIFNQEQQSAEFKSASSQSADSFDLAMEDTRRNIDIFNYYEGVTLTADQSDVVSKLKIFLTDNNQNVFILNGYAGTGKTFITKGFTQYLDAIGRDCTLMAPTGKAAKVLADKTGRQTGTIHRVIYSYDDLKEFDDNGIDSSETFRLYAQVKANLDTAEMVYIIDESSMVSDKYSDGEFFRFGSGYLLKDIFKFINIDHNDHNKKIIFIGDDAQLPPVGMASSPALDAAYLKETYQVKTISAQLTEVVRQKSESGVLKNASVIRQSLKANVFNQLVFDTSSQDVEKLSHGELLSFFIKACDNRAAKTGQSVIIASSNRKVGDFNRMVREYFFPNESKMVAGDKIISVANHYTKAGVITNGEFGMIKQVLSPMSEVREVFLSKKGEGGKTEKIKVILSFRDVVIAFRNQSGEPYWFETKIIDNLLYNDEPGVTSDEQKAVYVDFRKRHPHLLQKNKKQEFKMALQNDPYFNAFKVKFGYAITCHKAQGSEWENVFLECNSHFKVLTKDYFRWLYTAITRASSKLYVVNPPNLGIGGGMKVVGGLDLGDLENTQSQEIIPDSGTHRLNTAALNDSGPEFQFNDNCAHLRHLFNLVKQSLIGSNIEVLNVIHNSYQERYVFKRNTEHASVNFSYKGNYRVSAINSVSVSASEFDSELTALLSHIQGQILSGGSGTKNSEATFAEGFLAQFHEKVLSVIAGSDIDIGRIEQPDWAQRYSFIRGNETAVIMFWYDGKDRFTKMQPMPKLGNSQTLLRDFSSLWSQA